MKYLPTRNRPHRRHLLVTVAVTLALGAGFVLAAQSSGRADRLADPTDRELRPMWVPGDDVPMLTYLGAGADLPPAPPR